EGVHLGEVLRPAVLDHPVEDAAQQGVHAHLAVEGVHQQADVLRGGDVGLGRCGGHGVFRHKYRSYLSDLGRKRTGITSVTGVPYGIVRRSNIIVSWKEEQDHERHWFHCRASRMLECREEESEPGSCTMLRC